MIFCHLLPAQPCHFDLRQLPQSQFHPNGMHLDCPRFGPGPFWTWSGLNQTYRSKGPGQRLCGPALPWEVQVQIPSGPDLGFEPGPDPNRTHHSQVPVMSLSLYPPPTMTAWPRHNNANLVSAGGNRQGMGRHAHPQYWYVLFSLWYCTD
jgi:hypothetical protein